MSKFSENVERDKRREHELRALGWNVLTIWECETRNMKGLERRIMREFKELNRDQSMRKYQ
jgi:DNA mismatch endonuclease (patch repair protein)